MNLMWTCIGRYECKQKVPTPMTLCPDCYEEVTCKVCEKPILTAELCKECAEGNDPFFTSKYSTDAR